MITTLDELFDELWNDYVVTTPQAKKVHSLLTERGETVINDHIALRTYDDSRVNIDVLAAPFVKFGYKKVENYEFEEKKLRACHYEHEDKRRPKVFISELKLKDFSKDLQKTVSQLLDQIPEGVTRKLNFPIIGRPWKISHEAYEKLSKESEYAGWVAAFGFRANHFTVSANQLKTFPELKDLNQFLKEKGFTLNSSGGEIKGTKQEYLEQSSTMAQDIEVSFTDGAFKIPSCYYEFAKRYPLPSGELFQGFIAKSADKIFESTHRVTT